MKLYYHKGKNFGDQLNPLIFDHFMPGAFDENDNGLFVGIGSLIGLVSRFPQRKVVFSSGLADGDASTYGPVPNDLSSYEFVCVRGPLTAKRLGLNADLAITDGAILLAAMQLPLVRSHEVISFMPHAGSEQFYDHQKMAEELGWQFISPMEEPQQVLQKMMRSKFIVTEAMHGAIVADTLRIPWIPYVGFSTVNHFKWQDWCMSMELEYKPIQIKPYFNRENTARLINDRLDKVGSGMLKWTSPILIAIAEIGLKFRWSSNRRKLKVTGVSGKVTLSQDSIFQDRLNRMLEKVEWVKNNKEQWDK
jgi:succinoglycan biosynthesis protein ExoV